MFGASEGHIETRSQKLAVKSRPRSNPDQTMKRLLLIALLALAPNAVRAQEISPFTTARAGVNLAGAEFGDDKLPGVFDKNYTYPNAGQLDSYVAQKRSLIRLPFKWERVQHSLRAPLDADEVARLRAVLQAAAARKMDVILDAHNYGRYRFEGENEAQIIGAGRVGPADFADFWGKMAAELGDEPALYGYGLMNEPHDMGDDARWPLAAQAAIDAIRTVDAATPIVVAGDGWSSALRWATSSNAKLPAKLRDPADNLVYEAHCYFDKNQSGQYSKDYETELGSPDRGVENVRPFVEWCKTNQVRGFVGEFGVPDSDARWLETMTRFLDYLAANQISSTYWAGGPWWGNYPLSIEPRDGGERPQMTRLKRYAG